MKEDIVRVRKMKDSSFLTMEYSSSAHTSVISPGMAGTEEGLETGKAVEEEFGAMPLVGLKGAAYVLDVLTVCATCCMLIG